MERRTLVQSALAGSAAPLFVDRPAAAHTPTAGGFDAENPRFALAVLPDTRYLFDADSAEPAPLRETFTYLLAQKNVAFMTHLGDVTEHGTEPEIALASETFRADAGKSSGWSPEEPTCSLNLSPERFLQFVVYPTDVDADPTSWSHALPVGRWMHLAVVNDSRRTVVYVDGSRVARNPSRRAKGISTLGKPFVIGATQFAERYGQGFYGWIGDVRVSSRALAPREFMA
ncbi:hypothetical protein Val02_92390 [Virgisporangium aliadipatigenens]|uniref:LamG domain-containing protein n=1 Tax=Virgisporangium aliadipatigenens TaxID=741659 RepID=A0A8J3YXC3_9ACTN|nr:LamG-like jellyroll fold domain-containing protein [Virgisporangium aliadipatigenens]GIJ52353.1 hypothetical protein Val02_92390 [Virgisporangium aliadipatigenens]